MNFEQPFWKRAFDSSPAQAAREAAALLLEAAGPLTVLVAQGLYFSSPLLSLIWPNQSLHSLAAQLETPQGTQVIIRQLRRFPEMLREEER